jgi:hypothetical protein
MHWHGTITSSCHLCVASIFPVERRLIPEQAYISSVPLGRMVYQLLVSVRSYPGAISRIDGKRTNMARHGGIVTIPLSIAVEPRVLS